MRDTITFDMDDLARKIHLHIIIRQSVYFKLRMRIVFLLVWLTEKISPFPVTITKED